MDLIEAIWCRHVLGGVYLGADRCLEFKIEMWIELGKSMWKKHWSVFQDHFKYIHNDIVKTFRVGILQYAKCVREMHDLAKYLPTPSMKSVGLKEAGWEAREKEFNKDFIRFATKDRLPTSMQDALKYNHEGYR